MQRRLTNPILVLDGRTQLPTNFNQGVERASFFCSPRGAEPGSVILAFTSRPRFRAWARTQGDMLDRYDRAQALLRKFRKLPPAKEKEVARLQAARVAAETKRVRDELKERGINLQKLAAADLRTLERLAKGNERYGGPTIGSAFLFDGIAQHGAWVFLATGVWYPKFSWFSPAFNDRASSGIAPWPQGCTLFQHTYFRGSTYNFAGEQRNFYGFSNRASSGIAW